jgi:hypothetical protein
MRAEDEAARLAQIEQTRLEMERSNDDAKAAVDEKFVENAKKGMDARIEKDVLKAKREANESSQMERAKHLKERIELEKKKADLAREAAIGKKGKRRIESFGENQNNAKTANDEKTRTGAQGGFGAPDQGGGGGA